MMIISANAITALWTAQTFFRRHCFGITLALSNAFYIALLQLSRMQDLDKLDLWKGHSHQRDHFGTRGARYSFCYAGTACLYDDSQLAYANDE